MSPASRYHTVFKPLAFVGHAGGKIPTFGHHVGKKTTDGYLFENNLVFVSNLLKNEINITTIVHFLFQDCLKMKHIP